LKKPTPPISFGPVSWDTPDDPADFTAPITGYCIASQNGLQNMQFDNHDFASGLIFPTAMDAIRAFIFLNCPEKYVITKCLISVSQKIPHPFELLGKLIPPTRDRDYTHGKAFMC